MKKRILCIGDSNTWGYIPGGLGRYDEETRWTGRLAAGLGENFAVVEEGMNSRTTAFADRLRPGICALDYLYPCLISQFPLDVIVLMLGTNDAKARYHVSSIEIGNGMEEVLWNIRYVCGKNGQNPGILLVAPARMTRGEPGFGFDENSPVKIENLGKIYEALAGKHGCEYLSAYSCLDEGCIGEDGVHFTPRGHEILGKEILNRVRHMTEN